MPNSTTLTLRVNGEDLRVVFPTHHSLLEVLREECGLTGTKHGCELGECGTCMVLVDGKVNYACTARLNPGTVTVEPLANKRLIRDLVTDIVPPKERLAALD